MDENGLEIIRKRLTSVADSCIQLITCNCTTKCKSGSLNVLGNSNASQPVVAEHRTVAILLVCMNKLLTEIQAEKKHVTWYASHCIKNDIVVSYNITI